MALVAPHWPYFSGLVLRRRVAGFYSAVDKGDSILVPTECMRASSLRNPNAFEALNDTMPVHQEMRCLARVDIQTFVFFLRGPLKYEMQRRQPFFFEVQPCDHYLGVVANAELQAADRQGKGRGRETEIDVLDP